MKDSSNLSLFQRLVVAVLGLALFLTGLEPMARGEYSYLNWYRGLVFAPVALIMGGLIIYFAAFHPQFLERTQDAKRNKSRFRGWPR